MAKSPIENVYFVLGCMVTVSVLWILIGILIVVKVTS